MLDFLRWPGIAGSKLESRTEAKFSMSEFWSKVPEIDSVATLCFAQVLRSVSVNCVVH